MLTSTGKVCRIKLAQLYFEMPRNIARFLGDREIIYVAYGITNSKLSNNCEEKRNSDFFYITHEASNYLNRDKMLFETRRNTY